MDLFEFAEQQGCRADAPVPQLPCHVPADPTPEATAIRQVLARCIGKANCVTAPNIAARAGLWPDLRPADRGTRAREVIRTWLEFMAIRGHVLIAGSQGYWHSNDPKEIEKYLRTLHSRAMTTLDRYKRTRIITQAVPHFRHIGHGRFDVDLPELPECTAS